MNKMLRIFLYELKTTILRKSFMITLLILPILGLVITLFLGNRTESSGVSTILSKLTETEETTSTVGLVDNSKIITSIPEDYS